VSLTGQGKFLICLRCVLNPKDSRGLHSGVHTHIAPLIAAWTAQRRTAFAMAVSKCPHRNLCDLA
jgi:hypothetical protein